MNFVQPIREPEMIMEIKKYLKEQSERNYLLFMIGINQDSMDKVMMKFRI